MVVQLSVSLVMSLCTLEQVTMALLTYLPRAVELLPAVPVTVNVPLAPGDMVPTVTVTVVPLTEAVPTGLVPFLKNPAGTSSLTTAALALLVSAFEKLIVNVAVWVAENHLPVRTARGDAETQHLVVGVLGVPAVVVQSFMSSRCEQE